MPKFRKIIKDIQKDRFVRLGDIAQFSKETSDYSEYESGEFKYLEISGVSLGLNKYRTTTVSVSNAPSRAKMKTQDGDIVIALTRPHRGAIAQIKESGVISSTGFSVIRKVVTQIDREYLKQRIDAAKNKNNNGVVVYPTKQPYEELDQVGYWCLLNVLKAKDFQEFLGNSEAFDFYCEYAKFDFSRFDVSWLLNLYPHTLEQIAKNAKVKERVRVAIATTLDGEAIAPSDSQRLQSILVKHFC